MIPIWWYFVVAVRYHPKLEEGQLANREANRILEDPDIGYRARKKWKAYEVMEGRVIATI
jgi:hypothetical protein